MVRHVDSEMVFQQIKRRPRDCHKGDFGRLMLVVGSKNFPGAAIIASKAAYRSGCGYCFTASLAEVLDKVIVNVLEVCAVLLNERDGHISSESIPELTERIQKMDAVGFGCGITVNDDTEAVLSALLQCNKPLVIDADGLNVLSRDINLLKTKNCQVILTPHIGEFKRLSGIDMTVVDDKAAVLKSFADEYQVTVVLKGADTYVASCFSDEVYHLDNGTPGMAKAGSGDGLTGIISSLLAQGLSPVNAAMCGCWIHNEAGSMAAEKHSRMGMLVSDLIDCIGDVFLKYDR